MIKSFSNFKILESTSGVHSFEEMMIIPSKLFFDDVRDQLLGKVDNIITQSNYQSLFKLDSYYAVFEYRERIFKMQFVGSGLSAYCYYVETPPKNGYTSYKPHDITRLFGADGGTYIDIGSRSESIDIMFNKIDKFIKKLDAKV